MCQERFSFELDNDCSGTITISDITTFVWNLFNLPGDYVEGIIYDNKNTEFMQFFEYSQLSPNYGSGLSIFVSIFTWWILIAICVRN